MAITVDKDFLNYFEISDDSNVDLKIEKILESPILKEIIREETKKFNESNPKVIQEENTSKGSILEIFSDIAKAVEEPRTVSPTPQSPA